MNNLKKLRNEKNITQKELSKLSGVTLSKIAKYESGEIDVNNASAATLFKISIILKCSVEDLIDDELKKISIMEIISHFESEILELVNIEMDEGCHDDYIEDYENSYDFYISNVKKESYLGYISTLYPDLEYYCELEEIQDKIVKIIHEKVGMKND